jgi:hypothetical protein
MDKHHFLSRSAVAVNSLFGSVSKGHEHLLVPASQVNGSFSDTLYRRSSLLKQKLDLHLNVN